MKRKPYGHSHMESDHVKSSHMENNHIESNQIMYSNLGRQYPCYITNIFDDIWLLCTILPYSQPISILILIF